MPDPRPSAINGAETGLPPTPPSHSLDAGDQSAIFSSPPHADGVVSSLMSKTSSLGTPVNQRSPPTPDASPPRMTESMTLPTRPPLFPYPSSRAESFMTAREDLSTDGSNSRLNSPLADISVTMAKERGLGFAFEREDGCTTPTRKMQHTLRTPEREWDADLMRNVTVRKRRNPRPSPQKNMDSLDSVTTPTKTSPQLSSGLLEPITTSRKRLSGSSMASAVVEAMVIVTPPQRQPTLRHSGKNLAYRRDGDPWAQYSPTYSNRDSLNSDDIPLHPLVHKVANLSVRSKRFSSGSDRTGTDRATSSSSSRKFSQDSSVYTLAHQEAVRRVLQPAALIMSRSNSVSRPYGSDRSHHKRISSAPEPRRKIEATSSGLRTFMELSPLHQPAETFDTSVDENHIERTLHDPSSSLANDRSPSYSYEPPNVLNTNKSLPRLPFQSADSLATAPYNDYLDAGSLDENHHVTFHDAVSGQLEEPSAPQLETMEHTEHSTSKRRDSSSDSIPTESIPYPSLNRIPTEDLPRQSNDSRSVYTDDHARVSFDASTSRSEEHALARHLFAQTTPFSQISDTPIEVSEATAVSIFPHNNHSLLVVQQVARSSTFPPEQRELDTIGLAVGSPSQLPEVNEESSSLPGQPTLKIEPSTPPMQLSLPVPGTVDSPLKNPRAAPEPPIIQFIPPTPAEELERQLGPTPPGPPTRSDSHPQRRLSLVQRARRYSDTLISPFLPRSSSTRARFASETHTHDTHPRVPTVNDEDGALHPFWRPRGFWDGFDNSDSDGDDADEDVLPQGGDTSDVHDPEPEPSPRMLGDLGRRLTNGLKGSGGFLIGNSLGVERSGTNRRMPRIDLGKRRGASRTTTVKAPKPAKAKAPMIVVQRPTLPLGIRSRSPRVEKRSSSSSIRSAERNKQDDWRHGKRIPGMGLQIQYIGLSGVKERFREKRAEKRREGIRRSIGTRYYVEDGIRV